jgi:hypothetical protein
MPTTRQPVKAWVLYWSDYYAHGQRTNPALDGEVVAVLPIRWGHKPVRDVLERLFAERRYTPSELISYRQSGIYEVESDKARLHDDATRDNHFNWPVIGYSIGDHWRLLARQAEHVRVVDSPWEIAWQELGPIHEPVRCAAVGVLNCSKTGEPDFAVDKSWRRPTE